MHLHQQSSLSCWYPFMFGSECSYEELKSKHRHNTGETCRTEHGLIEETLRASFAGDSPRRLHSKLQHNHKLPGTTAAGRRCRKEAERRLVVTKHMQTSLKAVAAACASFRACHSVSSASTLHPQPSPNRNDVIQMASAGRPQAKWLRDASRDTCKRPYRFRV